jgi:hypothetical protein
MTVVTAFAVSWNPLMNSNPNAMNSAIAKKILFGRGISASASQSDISTP